MSTDLRRYNVRVVETIEYVVSVEASDKEDARKAAREAFVQSENPYDDFDGSVENRSFSFVLDMGPVQSSEAGR